MPWGNSGGRSLERARGGADGPGQNAGFWAVQIRPDSKTDPIPLRVVAIRKSPVVAEESRQKARHAAKRHGHAVSQATLEAADYVLLLTTLPETAAEAADLLA